MKKLPTSLPAGFWTHSEETGQIPDYRFYKSLRNCPNRCQRGSTPSVMKPAQFQPAVSICQFLCPGTTLYINTNIHICIYIYVYMYSVLHIHVLLFMFFTLKLNPQNDCGNFKSTIHLTHVFIDKSIWFHWRCLVFSNCDTKILLQILRICAKALFKQKISS